MRTSEQINEIAAALAKAQGAIEGAKKDSLNPHFRSKYADLGAVWDACRDALTKNGIAVIQPVDLRVPPDGSPTALRVTVTRLVHSSGQWMEDGGIPLILSKEDMQGLGSALTYSRRYGLMAMVGIAPEDDDGNAASQAQTKKEEAPKGFDQWNLDLICVAEEGTEPLKKMWAAARPDFRQYMTKYYNADWEALKAKAAKKEAVPA
jgi:hypothetical protein